MRFLEQLGELDDEEKAWLGTPAEQFLKLVEQTRFTKSYKIPTISAFLKQGTILSKVSLDDIGEETMRFFMQDQLHQKDLGDTSNKSWKSWGLKGFSRQARKNPVKFLSQGAFFNFDEINNAMYLDESLEPYLSPLLAAHVKDILNYREKNYFRRRYSDRE